MAQLALQGDPASGDDDSVLTDVLNSLEASSDPIEQQTEPNLVAVNTDLFLDDEDSLSLFSADTGDMSEDDPDQHIDELVAGMVLVATNSLPTDDDGGTIIVTGTRFKYSEAPDFGGGVIIACGWNGLAMLGGGGGGGAGSTFTSVKVADHTQDCGASDDGAAVQVARRVTGQLPAGVSGPSDPLLTKGLSWTSVEFGAVIVNNGNGTFGTLNDAIYSNGLAGRVTYPSVTGTNAVGLWHSHVTRGDDLQHAIDRYPSVFSDDRGDWSALQRLKDVVAPNDPNFDPSMWITGPDGVTREFKLSERAYYESLTPDQMRAGAGLAGKERMESCS